jgi:HAD superfamily hydrolase (TIGR01509 family)
MTLSPPELSALIFDFDGLMVDTESAIFHSWQEIYAAHGQVLELASYVQCVGSHGSAYDPLTELETLVAGPLDRTELMAWQSQRNRELHEGLDALPGIRELLLEAEALELPCAVASSSNALWVHGWLDQLALRPHFTEIITRDDVARAKPAPDLFLLALQKLGVAASDALVLEDSANGLLAAVAAEVPCIIIPNEVTRGLDFTAARAVLPTLHGVSVTQLALLACRR